MVGKCNDIIKSGGFREYECGGLQSDSKRWVVLHMFDPFVTDADVTTFLSRYVDVRTGPLVLSDTRTVWTGKRRYLVELRRDPTTKDGYSHPPATFAIGGGRGYMFYWDQPEFCRKCRTTGHREGACTAEKCGKCGRPGHHTRDCQVKECSLCGDRGHLFRQCSK
ncbi:ZCHC3 protein, partial [Atractosteus spatula]|nr:ZCHC3 protein [Atractosteus spatula]